MKDLTYQRAIDYYSFITRLSRDSSHNACINGIVCNDTKKDNLNTYKQYTIKDTHNYFIITPNLFKTSGRGKNFKQEKISDIDIKIKYSDEITLNGKKYELIGIVSHNGDTGGGHYISFVKKNGKWWKMDDSKKAKNVNLDPSIKPYMAFYKNIEYNISKNELSKLKMIDPPRGIINPGIYCYANALMQILFNNETLYYDLTQQFNKDVPILKPNASVLRTNSTKDSDPTSVPQKINSNKNKTQLLQKVSGVLWKPPAGSNNGSNKCWVNAPLYSILSNTDIQQKIKNMPEENIVPAVSSNLLSLVDLKSFFTADLINNLTSLTNLQNLIYKLKIKINNVEEAQLNSLSFDINFKDIEICKKLEDTVLNRLHITIFIKSLTEQFSNFFKNFKETKLNEKIKTLIVEKSNKVNQYFKDYENKFNKLNIYSTFTKKQLQPLYLRALKQFIDNKTPWTNVLYQTFALFIQKNFHAGSIKDKMIYENEFSGADYTIVFIIQILKKNNVQNLTHKFFFNFNDIKNENVISIVSTTRCTTDYNTNGGHFISFIKNNDDWDGVDALKNFVVKKFDINQLKDYQNCTNNKKKNTTRQMLAIIYDQQSPIIHKEPEPSSAFSTLAQPLAQSQTPTQPIPIPAQQPSSAFSTLAQPLAQSQPTPTPLAIPVQPETSTNFSNVTINKFTDGFNKLDNSVQQISQKLANLKQNLNKLKKPMAGGATQKGGANIEKDIPIYENILNIVNQEELLKDFIADTYTLLTNLWDPEKNIELKNYLNNNPNDEIQEYFIKDNDKYYFSDVIYTQIMLGQLNSDVYPNTITKNNLTRYYNKKFKK